MAGGCNTCSLQLSSPGLDPAQLCPSSLQLYESFLDCACGRVCGELCSSHPFCNNGAGPWSTACIDCLTNKNSLCLWPFDQCQGDG
jgi:hypothetical protein